MTDLFYYDGNFVSWMSNHTSSQCKQVSVLLGKSDIDGFIIMDNNIIDRTYCSLMLIRLDIYATIWF